MTKAHVDPADVTADQGEVVLDGFDGLVVSLDPSAAIETGHRLIDAALRAQRQKEAAPSPTQKRVT